MSPVVKKLIAGFAATKAFEKVQEIRRPRQSFLRRNLGKFFLVGIAGGTAAYLYKNGKLDALTGGGGSGSRLPGPVPAGPRDRADQAARRLVHPGDLGRLGPRPSRLPSFAMTDHDGPAFASRPQESTQKGQTFEI